MFLRKLIEVVQYLFCAESLLELLFDDDLV